MYSNGCVIIDTWSAGEYEIMLDCAWYYTTAHTHVSAVAHPSVNDNAATVVRPNKVHMHNNDIKMWTYVSDFYES